MKDIFLYFWKLLAYFVMDVVYRLVFRARGIGKDNVPETGGLFLASNHTSGMDIPIIPYFALDRFSTRRFHTPAKEDLFKNPLISLFIKSLRAFPVKRTGRDVESMHKIIRMAKTDVIVIFPEGTRTRDGNLKPGKPGMGRLIHEARVPVVPTLVINTCHAMYKGNLLPNFGQEMYVVFGKPLELDPYFAKEGTKEGYRSIVNYLMGEISKLKEQYRHLEVPPRGAIAEAGPEGTGTDDR